MTAASLAASERRHGTEPIGLDRGRSSGLDGLRFLASLFVLLFHVRSLTTITFGPFDRFIMGGDTGVWMFFALSGYLLYRPFLTKRVDLREYALKRAARLIPGYYVALGAVVVLTMPALFFAHPLPYLTGTFTYDIPLRSLFGNAWTLSAEVLFYVTLPLLARAARGRETAVLGGLAVASIGLSIVQRATMTQATEWMHGSYPTVFYAFVPGMLLAALEVKRPDVLHRLARPLYLVLGVALLALGSVSTILPIPFATLAGTPLVMGWLLQHRAPFPRALAFGGGASYTLYLLHKDLLIAFGLPGIALAFVGAAASWKCIERPILSRAHAVADASRKDTQLESIATAPGTA
jgi:peptidoglycan/LPS O-acetylase OafA/YrhL